MKSYAAADRVSKTVYVQGVGRAPGKQAGEVRPGDRLMFSAAQVWTVTDTTTDKFVYLTMTNGKRTVTLKKRPTTMVAVVS